MVRTFPDLLKELDENPPKPEDQLAAFGLSPKEQKEAYAKHGQAIANGLRSVTKKEKEWHYVAYADSESGSWILKIQPYPKKMDITRMPIHRKGAIALFASIARYDHKRVYFAGPPNLRSENEFRNAELRKLSDEEVTRIEEAKRKHTRPLHEILRTEPERYPEYLKKKKDWAARAKLKGGDVLKLSYALANLSLLEQTVSIRKDRYKPLFSRQQYSVWLGDQPIVMYLDDKVEALAAAHATDPLKPREVDMRKVQVDVAKEMLGLHKYDLITPSGYILFGKQRKVANDVFWRVRNGWELLPSPDDPLGYKPRKRHGPRGEGEPIVFNTKEQRYLRRSYPRRIESGEILGGGGTSLAFYFNNNVLVESDEHDKATYIFDIKHFDKLRHMARQTLMAERPRGFIDRIIHDEDIEKWRAGVKQYFPKRKE